MANFYRAIVICLLCFCTQAKADTYFQAWALNSESGWYSTQDAAASNLLSVYVGSRGKSYAKCLVNGVEESRESPYNWRIKNGEIAADRWTCGSFMQEFYPGGTETWGINYRTKALTCLPGQEIDPVKGVCVNDRRKEKACGADFTYAGWGVGFGKYTEPWAINGYVPSGEQCDAYTDAEPGGTGCKVYFAATGTTKNDNGTTTTTGNFRPVPGDRAGEGVPCSPTYEGEGKDVVDEKSKEKCNGYEGTVGGETKCIPNVQNNGVEWAKTEKVEKKSDGTTTETKVEQKCEKDKCTTTTTVTNKDAAGNTTTTSSSETKQDVALFCKENSDKCKDGKPVADKGSGGGSGGGTGSGSGGTGNGSGSCTGSDCSDNNAPGGPGKVGMPGSGAAEVGSFYEREYKQGPVQLWSEKTAQLKESGLGALASNLMPNVGDGGVEPTWIIDLDFGPLGNYGVRDISPPSWVWGVIRAITILSALVVARKLIFGG